MIHTVGRIILGSFFVLAGINKIANYAETAAGMDAVGLPGLLLPLVIALEIVGGVIVASARPARLVFPTGLVLAGFTVLTNVFFHDFWAQPDHLAPLELSMFFKNLAIAGALLMVAGGAVRTEKTAVPTR